MASSETAGRASLARTSQRLRLLLSPDLPQGGRAIIKIQNCDILLRHQAAHMKRRAEGEADVGETSTVHRYGRGVT
eukprot:4701874-Pleurochrysis_carterae.AAC.1